MSNCSRQSLLNWCLVHTKGTLKVNADEKRSHRVQLEGGLVPKFTKRSKVLLENSNCRGFFTVYRAKKNTMGHSICRTKSQWNRNIFEFAFHTFFTYKIHSTIYENGMYFATKIVLTYCSSDQEKLLRSLNNLFKQ